MPYNNRTEAEWEEIKFKNNLNPQLGGLIKQAVDIAIAKNDITKNTISDWLRALYEIIEEEKAEIMKEHSPKSTTNTYLKDSEIDDLNAELSI
jgi:hypothetical protein